MLRSVKLVKQDKSSGKLSMENMENRKINNKTNCKGLWVCCQVDRWMQDNRISGLQKFMEIIGIRSEVWAVTHLNNCPNLISYALQTAYITSVCLSQFMLCSIRYNCDILWCWKSWFVLEFQRTFQVVLK